MNKTPILVSDIQNTRFSLFPQGYRNQSGKAVPSCYPFKDAVTIDDVGDIIRYDNMTKEATEKLRSIKDHVVNCAYKVLAFMIATFSGVFDYRSVAHLLWESVFVVIDIDEKDILAAFPDIPIDVAVKQLKQQFVNDKNISTALCFISPNGNGVKWVVYVGDKWGLSHRECFDVLSRYIETRHKVKVDASGSDICRACFLPHDPECYVDGDVEKMHMPDIDVKGYLAEIEAMKNPAPVHRQNQTSTSSRYNTVFDLVEDWVSRDVQYAKGTYNRYVMKCCYKLCEFGVDQNTAEQWAVSRFNDYRSSDVRSIVRSCYRKAQFGIREFKSNNLNKVLK